MPYEQEKVNRQTILDRAQRFALAAIDRDRDDWKSDESAEIYCRCRTLPVVISHLPKFDARISQLFNDVLFQLKDNRRLAIGEAWTQKPADWYPPNAYHTYWTLDILKKFSERFPDKYNGFANAFKSTGLPLERFQEEMLTWARQAAGYQIALHSSEASAHDSDQLAWSLAIILTFDSDFQSDLPKQNFISYGLQCLFDHQTTDGSWKTGKHLFHYKKSGNAYCYVFETFTVLLKSALTKRQESLFLRKILSPYADKLLNLWRYAEATRIISLDSGASLWSSGHRANKQPESWATASVYSFSQCLRRLLGIWTREAVALRRKAITARQSRAIAIDQLSRRGDTWTGPNDYNAANQLMALYVNPVRFSESDNELEPDSQPIADNQARAAILFGPPGTSKTTLARNVALAIGWDYVELHSSHFVADGLPNVQRTADQIFGELMQLDRTVILFDEIDELVRAREGADAFGRFLTTSMLPKLAELWKGRRVIYFVATNHIKFFDPAIRRAERFDTLVNVSPPSFKIKIHELLRLLNNDYVRHAKLTQARVEAALMKVKEIEEAQNGEASAKRLPNECNLAKFLLIRWDQLPELASLIRKRASGHQSGVLTFQLLAEALSDLSEPSLMTCEPFVEYLESRQYQQYDFSKVSVWEVTGTIPKRFQHKVTQWSKDEKAKYLYKSKTGFADFGQLSPDCRVVAPGMIRISA